MKIVFFDTNIWIYAHLEFRDLAKHEKTTEFLKDEINKSFIITSVQAINEFHWVLLKKYKIDNDIISKKVKSIIKISNIVPISLQTYTKANSIRKKYDLSFWDSLIVSSALENEAELLYSEDMRHGRVIEGSLKIVNPFV